MKHILVASGCLLLLLVAWSFTHRYQFHTAGDMFLYRCDTITGTCSMSARGSSWIQISDR